MAKSQPWADSSNSAVGFLFMGGAAAYRLPTPAANSTVSFSTVFLRWLKIWLGWRLARINQPIRWRTQYILYGGNQRRNVLRRPSLNARSFGRHSPLRHIVER